MSADMEQGGPVPLMPSPYASARSRGLRQSSWTSVLCSERSESLGGWVTGGVLCLLLLGLLPVGSFMAFLLFGLLCAATLLRAYALQQYTAQLLGPLQAGRQEAPAALRRRLSRQGLLLALAGGRGLDLLNLRLSLVDRDFDSGDYDLLLALDEGEPGEQQRRQSIPDGALAALPVHLHRSPCKPGRPSGGVVAAPPPGRVPVLVHGPQDCWRPAQAAAPQQHGVPGAAQGGPGQEDDPVCSICLDSFAHGAKVMRLPCAHEFHADCVVPWLRLKGLASRCPACKAYVFERPPS